MFLGKAYGEFRYADGVDAPHVFDVKREFADFGRRGGLRCLTDLYVRRGFGDLRILLRCCDGFGLTYRRNVATPEPMAIAIVALLVVYRTEVS